MSAIPSASSSAAPPRLARIRRLSRVMVVICHAVAVLLPLGLAAFWLAAPAELLAAQGKVPPGWLVSFGPLERVVGLAISFISLTPLVWGLTGAGLSFRSFAAGDLFGRQATGGLRRFSLGLLFSAILQPVVMALLSVLMSWEAPAGQRQLVLGVSSDTLLVVLFAGMVAIIGWVLAEASVIAEENAQFV